MKWHWPHDYRSTAAAGLGLLSLAVLSSPGLSLAASTCGKGTTWAAQTISGANNLNNVIWSGSQFVAAGFLGKVYASPSAAAGTWTAGSLSDAGTDEMHGLAWSGKTFVLAGTRGRIYTSADAVNWAFINPPPTNNYLESVVWTGSQFVAVGFAGTVLIGSADGRTWTVETPITGGPYIHDIAWSGSTLVAVGDTGAIFISADGGNHWTDKSDTVYLTNKTLNSVAWSGSRFVAVGYSGAVVTSSDGASWTNDSITVTPPSAGLLSSVTWSGSQFLAVADGATFASPDGTTWTQQDVTGSHSAVTWSGDTFVTVGTAGNAQLSDTCSWGDELVVIGTPVAKWTQIGLPGLPSPATPAGALGTAMGGYGTTWVMSLASNARLGVNQAINQSTGYWLKQLTAADVSVPLLAATATPLVTGNPLCPSTVGCYEITLTAPASGADLNNMIAFPLPYPVAWWNVRLQVTVGGVPTAFTPAAANALYMQKVYGHWNGNTFIQYDDVGPTNIGILQPWQGIFIKVKPGSSGKSPKLLIPAIPEVSQAPTRRAAPWPARALAWLIPTAAAQEITAPAVGVDTRAARVAAEGQALQAGWNWYLRLLVEEPTLRMVADNSVFGQLDGTSAGYDDHDFAAMAPFGTPYLTVVFPHPEWGAKAGDYNCDYRPVAPGTGADNWTFEVRSDRPRKVLLRFAGPRNVMANSELIDVGTGTRYFLDAVTAPEDGIWITMTKAVQRFTWVYRGR